MDWLDGLNAAQREAVTHGEGPLLVIAGAGTGKTRTLAARVAYLIAQGVPAERILLLTFTRRAAAEMIGRAGQLTDQGSAGRVWGGTFHSVANRLLRMYARPMGLPADFTVMDQGDAGDLMNIIRNELGVAKKDRRFPRKETLVGIYSRTVNAEQKLREVLEQQYPWCVDDYEGIREILREYVKRKREQNVFDYDDLLLYWNELCETPGLGETVASRFDHILVDEYQDTNAVQARILQGMRRTNRNIMVVGDDAQSIYSFRAATVRNILDFPKQFPGTRIVTLEQNYRSTEAILKVSNLVMEGARERYTKNLWSGRLSAQKPVLVTVMDEPEQTVEVCRRIVSFYEQGIPLIRQAVLFRAGYHSDQLEVELARRKLPFHKYGGLKFIEAAHVKDLIALLRILENPYDEISWFRVLLLLDGIGPQSARRILEELGVRAGGATADGSPHRRLIERPPKVPPAAAEQFRQLRSTILQCVSYSPSAGLLERSREEAEAGEPGDAAEQAEAERASHEPPLAVQIERIRRFYDPIFNKRYDNPRMRVRDLEQLEQIAAGYRSRSRFITDLTLDPPASTADLAGPPELEEDYLTLSTIHSAKGCEWDVVIIIHAADGNIPSDMALQDEAGLEEERRLFYVALTRARDHLYVFCPLRYYHTRRFGDSHSYAQLTRFITPEVRAHFHEEGVSAVRDPADDASPGMGGGQSRRVTDRINRFLDD